MSTLREPVVGGQVMVLWSKEVVWGSVGPGGGCSFKWSGQN